MKVERTEQAIIVDLSQEETFRIQAGNVVSDRPGITLPDAKIHVWPLSAIEPDDSLKDRWDIDRLGKGLSSPLKARMDTDGDLSIFVPAIKLSDVRISGARLPRELIETPGIKREEDRERFLHHAIPEKGVILNFGGSLRVVDLGPAAYYEAEE